MLVPSSQPRGLPTRPDRQFLIDASENVESELGIHLEPARERLDLLRDLHLHPGGHPIDAAVDGSWR